MRVRTLLWWSACSALLAGCTADLGGPECVRFSRHGGYCLQAAATEPSREVQQEVVLLRDGVRHTLIVQIESAPERLRVVGLAPFGRLLLDLAYESGVVSAPTLPDARIDPALLLAMVQLTDWPATAILRGLRGDLEIADAAGRRELRDPDGVVLSVEPAEGEGGSRRIRLPALRLEIEVRMLDMDGAQ